MLPELNFLLLLGTIKLQLYCIVFFLCFSHNTEKVVYFLLLDRKLRKPSREDEEEVKAKTECSACLYWYPDVELYTWRLYLSVVSVFLLKVQRENVYIHPDLEFCT